MSIQDAAVKSLRKRRASLQKSVMCKIIDGLNPLYPLPLLDGPRMSKPGATMAGVSALNGSAPLVALGAGPRDENASRESSFMVPPTPMTPR